MPEGVAFLLFKQSRYNAVESIKITSSFEEFVFECFLLFILCFCFSFNFVNSCLLKYLNKSKRFLLPRLIFINNKNIKFAKSPIYPYSTKQPIKAPIGVKILFYMESEHNTFLYSSEFSLLDKVYPIKIGCCVFKLWLADVRQITKNFDAFCRFLLIYT